MSMFQIPEELIPGTKALEKMNAEMSRKLGQDLQNAANLFAHPAAGVAAASALGIGLASHSFGMWMGIVTGATEATQRLFAPIVGDVAGDVESFADKPEAPAKRAEATVKVLIADAKRTVQKPQLRKPVVTEPEQSVPVAPAPLTVVQAVAPAVEIAAPAPQVVAPVLMPEDFRQPKAMDKPDVPDDLKVISGIGPKLENVLNGFGIWTYAQVAAWTPQEIAWVDDTLGFKGRIGRDDWIGQATRLAAGKAG